jgi:hypothetical protein
MSTYRFDRLLAPRSVALVGASVRERMTGRCLDGRSAGARPAAALVLSGDLRHLSARRTMSERPVALGPGSRTAGCLTPQAPR